MTSSALAPAGLLARLRERGFLAASILGAALVFLPVASLLVMATGGASDLSPVFFRIVLPYAVRDTLLLLAGVAIGVSAIGVGAAWLVTAYDFPGRGLLTALLAAPLAMPTYVAAYVWVEILEPLGPVQRSLRALLGIDHPPDLWFPAVRSLGGAIVIFSLVLYPYVYLTVRAVFMAQSASLLEVARSLGRGPAGVFVAVALPLARPALAAGLTLALLEALNDVGASQYLGLTTLAGTVMDVWLTRNSLSGAALIACAMLAIVILVLAAERLARRDRRFAVPVQKPRIAAPVRLRGAAALLVIALCAAPVLVALALPAGYLALETVDRIRLGAIDPRLWRQTVTTVALSSAATILVMALGTLMVLAWRAHPTRFRLFAMRAGALGYAVPGTVLAVGMMAPMVGFDSLLTSMIGWFVATQPTLWLTGSGLGLVLAYTIRFLTISIGAMESQLARYSPHIDHAARALGRDAMGVAREVHLPLLRPALAAAALLVFIDCLKELPATLLLRPLNGETLATALYEHASRAAFQDGAAQALIIVAAGLIPALRLTGRSASAV